MRPPARLGHVRGLDGIRGIAVLLVVACHDLALGGGFLGVEIFFVLSGFLITTLLLEEHEQGGTVRLRRFYVRRVRRLYPALAATLLAWLALAAAAKTPAGFRTEALGALASAVYVADTSFAWLSSLPLGLQHLWTLALEEQFYVVWPPLLLLALRRRLGPRGLLRVLLAAFVCMAAFRTALSLHGTGTPVLYESPATAGGGLILGCALAVARVRGLPRLLERHAAPLGLGSLVFLLALALHGPGVQSRAYFTGLLVLVDVASALLVLAVVVASAAPVARICSVAWLRWVGRISYSLYLIHPIVLVELVWRGWVTAQAGIVLSVLIAAGMHRFIEQPFRRARRHRAAAPAPVYALPEPVVGEPV